MSTDDRFRGVDWELVHAKLTLRARQLFAAAKAKGYGNALARACTDSDELAHTVVMAVLENESVKFKPSKGASLTTFLCQVLERRFIDLLRQGGRHNSRLKALDSSSKPDSEPSTEPGVIRDISDGGQVAKVIHLRAAALHAVNGDKKLEEYLTAAFDCGASKRADQAELLGVAPSEITNLRKKFHRLLRLDVENFNDDLGSEE